MPSFLYNQFVSFYFILLDFICILYPIPGHFQQCRDLLLALRSGVTPGGIRGLFRTFRLCHMESQHHIHCTLSLLQARFVLALHCFVFPSRQYCPLQGCWNDSGSWRKSLVTSDELEALPVCSLNKFPGSRFLERHKVILLIFL